MLSALVQVQNFALGTRNVVEPPDARMGDSMWALPPWREATMNQIHDPAKARMLTVTVVIRSLRSVVIWTSFPYWPCTLLTPSACSRARLSRFKALQSRDRKEDGFATGC